MLYQPVGVGHGPGWEKGTGALAPSDGTLVAPDVCSFPWPSAVASLLRSRAGWWGRCCAMRGCKVRIRTGISQVNLSAGGCARPRTFVPHLQEQCVRTAWRRTSWSGEVTERVCAWMPRWRQKRLRALRRLEVADCQLTTLHRLPSPAYLTQLPLDLLKIDKAFVAPTTGPPARVIERSSPWQVPGFAHGG